jgi:hypothetical protein
LEGQLRLPILQLPFFLPAGLAAKPPSSSRLQNLSRADPNPADVARGAWTMANDCLQVVEEWVVTRDKERERAVTDLTEAAEVRRRGL